jgi:hypothetical protein
MVAKNLPGSCLRVKLLKEWHLNNLPMSFRSVSGEIPLKEFAGISRYPLEMTSIQMGKLINSQSLVTVQK